MTRPIHIRSLYARYTAARALLALVAVAALGAFLPVQAEPPAAQEDSMQAARQLHGEYVELQNRLGMIQEKTMEAHPELQKQEQALVDLMMAKMSGSGSSAKDELAAIEKLEQALRSEDTPDSEREALMTQYRDKAMAFRNAQMQAMQDPEVKKAQSTLMDATLEAMKQQDPQTEQLMQQLQQKGEQLQQMMEASDSSQ